MPLTTRSPRHELGTPRSAAVDDFVGDPCPRTDWKIVGIVVPVVVAVVVAAVVWPEPSVDTAVGAFSAVLTHTGWFFSVVTNGCVFFAIYLGLSRFGRIRLGPDDSEPEYGTVPWIGMMLAAGMGLGLVFYGMNEPLAHFSSPPPGTGAGDSPVRVAMATTLFHWTLVPWSLAAVVGLSVAYGVFRRGRPHLISAALAPLIGRDRAAGALGKSVDVLAVFVTLFSSAASLGVGTLQIAAAMRRAGWIGTTGWPILATIIVVLTGGFVTAAIRGVLASIRWLSDINMVLAVLLAGFALVFGPTAFLLDLIPSAIGSYVGDFGVMVARSTPVAGGETASWAASWTLFYWMWWVAWTPLFGVFLARISRGRTIRQFVGGVLLGPSAVSTIWFVMLGGTAINSRQLGDDLAPSGFGEDQVARLDHLPLPWITPVAVMLLVGIFFITGLSVESGVLASLSQHGARQPQRRVILAWGLLSVGLTALMLFTGEGDNLVAGVQNLGFLGSLPLAVVVVLLCCALLKDLRDDPAARRSRSAKRALDQAVGAGTERDGRFRLRIGPAAPAGRAKNRP